MIKVQMLELAQILIAKGALKGNEHIIFKAIQVGSLELVQLLLQNGIYVDKMVNKSGLSALHLAAEFGHLHLVKYLIDEGLVRNVNAKASKTFSLQKKVSLNS